MCYTIPTKIHITRLIIIQTFAFCKRFGLKPLQRLQPGKESHACLTTLFNINAYIFAKIIIIFPNLVLLLFLTSILQKSHFLITEQDNLNKIRHRQHIFYIPCKGPNVKGLHWSKPNSPIHPQALPAGRMRRRRTNADVYNRDADSRGCYKHKNKKRDWLSLSKKIRRTLHKWKQCFHDTLPLHIYIYKKRMWHSHSVYIPPIAYRQNYIGLRTRLISAANIRRTLSLLFNA